MIETYYDEKEMTKRKQSYKRGYEKLQEEIKKSVLR